MKVSGGVVGYNLDSPVTGGSRTTVQNYKEGLTTYDFDSQWNLKVLTLPPVTGATQPVQYSMDYDSKRNMTSASDGSVTLTMEYEANGFLKKITDPDLNLRRMYYSGVNLTSITDNLGTILTVFYEDPLLPNIPTAAQDALGNRWQYGHNSHGQLTTVTAPNGSPLGVTTYAYNENILSPSYGWLKEITDGFGNKITFDDYSLVGDVLSSSTYIDPDNPSTQQTVNMTYNGAHRTKTYEHPDGKTVSYNYSGTRLEYEDDEATKRTSYTWCKGCGALESVSRALGWSLNWIRDFDHDVRQFVDARANPTKYTYGKAAELSQVQYPDSSTEQYTYDNSARLGVVRNGRSQDQVYGYDSTGRLHTITFPTTSEPTMTYHYRADGLPDLVTDAAGETSYEYYDNRLLKAVVYDYSLNGLLALQRVEYVYWPDGSVHYLTWKSDGNPVAAWTYTYDTAGRMSTIESFGESVSFTYDGEDKLLTQTNANGTQTEYVYNDQRGWPEHIYQRYLEVPFAEYDLTYDLGLNTVGNLTHVEELSGDLLDYGYDDLYRLTSEARSGLYSNSFQYDLAGNLSTLDGQPFATYDAANKIASIPSGTVSHDGDGSMTGFSGPGLPSATLTWDTRSKLTSQSDGATTFQHGYDAEGRRVWTQAGIEPKKFYVFSNRQVIGEIENGVPTVAYTWGANGLAAKRDLVGDASYAYHFGPQGETRELTDGSGGVVSTYLYDAYGQTLSQTGTVSNPFRYGGRYGYYSEGPAGLMLAGARWYSAGLKRWVSRDPIKYQSDSNLYGYARGDPLNYYDDGGLAPFRNRSRGKIRIKPESQPAYPPTYCPSRRRCNIDGLLDLGPYPYKVTDNCTCVMTVNRQIRLNCRWYWVKGVFPLPPEIVELIEPTGFRPDLLTRPDWLKQPPR